MSDENKDKKPEATKPTPVEAPTPAVPTQAPSPVPGEHDETDVEAALQRQTQDGKGDGEVPEPDFKGFATAGVEQTALLSVEEVTSQVLAGHWGSTAKTAANRLEAVGYDVEAVAIEFERRKKAGAPSAF